MPRSFGAPKPARRAGSGSSGAASTSAGCSPTGPPAARSTGALLSIEGLQNLEGRLDNVGRLHAAGFRMAGLAHFFDNEVAGSMHGLKKGGLTPLGRQVVRRDGAARDDRRHRPFEPRRRRRDTGDGEAAGRLQPWRGAGDLPGQPQPHRRGDPRSRPHRRPRRDRLLGRGGLRPAPRRRSPPPSPMSATSSGSTMSLWAPISTAR